MDTGCQNNHHKSPAVWQQCWEHIQPDWSSREQYTLISISGFRLWRVNGQCNEYGYIIKCIYNTFGHFIDLPRLHAGFFYWWTGNRRWWRPPGRCSSSPSCQTDPRAARRPFLSFSAIGRNNLALVYIYMIRSVKEIYWENTVWSYWITLQIV